MKKTLILKLLSLIVITSLAIGVVGCSKQASSSKNTADKDSDGFDIIKMATPSSPITADSITIAEELGYFKDVKIKINHVGVISSDQVMPSLTTGNIDVGGGHIPRGIGAVAAGAKIKAVAANTQTTKEKPHMTFVVLKDSPIKTAQDMLGKRVVIFAHGGCPEYTPREYLKKEGISNPIGKFSVVIAPGGKEEQVLRKGDADVAGIHSDPETLLNRGGLRVLFTDYDIWGEEGGQAPFYMTDKFIKDNPDLVKRFVSVIAKVNNWINENPDKAREIYAKKFNVKPNTVSVNHYAPDAIIKENTVKIWVDILKDYKEIKKDVPLKDIYTNEYNSKAQK